ncbi:Beta-glucosidase 1 [Yarrowia sp. B02]|nr:Beta-glucosidase 1 [Yarrowia sp. B02]
MLLLVLLLAVLVSCSDWYPTPEVGTLETSDSWRRAFNQSLDILSQLTIPEKVNITTGAGLGAGICVGNTGGVPRLGIKGLCLDNGPLGISQTNHITVFPCGIAMGATFDRQLVRRRGTALGRESKKKGIDVHLGPVVGPLGRHARGGRNWEGFTNDPYLSGKLASEAVQGVQGENVMATIKHLIGNEQEHFRKLGEWQTFGFKDIKAPLSSNIDDRTLNEVYLWPFGDAVRAGAAAAMCSYQLVNGTQACQSSSLINGKLKSELGFQGFLMSDWLAQESGVSNALAGLDMSMPGNEINGHVFWGEELTRMVVNGTVPESRLDDMVLRILTQFNYLKLDDDREPNFSYFTTDIMGNPHPLPVYNNSYVEQIVNYQIDTRDAFSTDVALESAQAAVVLLHNDGILPLKNQKSLGVFGVGSQTGPNGAVCKNMACSDGALIVGWGSGSAYPTEYQSPFEALRRRAVKDGVYVTGTKESWNMSLPQIIAYNSDVNIVYVLATSGEADAVLDGNLGDRNNVSLWHNGDNLISAVASQGKTVVVVTTVGPVDMEPWTSHPNISAVLLTGPAGDYGGKAMAGALFGDFNPSGKLPYTIAKNASDYIPIVSQVPSDGLPQANFEEGIFIDYKWFDKFNKTPRYEFGYGLSYSNFTFSDLEVSLGSISELLPDPPSPITVDKPRSRYNATEFLYMPTNFTPVNGIVYPWLKNDSTTGYSNVSVSHTPGNITHNSTFQFANGTGFVSRASGGVGGNPALWKTAVTVSHVTKNNGPYAGRVVSQLYVSLPCNSSPKVQLRGFDKSPILLDGESQVTSYDLHWRDLAVWDVVIQSWRVPRGEYQIFVGHSSRDLVLSHSFTL